MRFKDQGVLVTGGASGIGEKVLQRSGARAPSSPWATGTRRERSGSPRRCARPAGGRMRSRSMSSIRRGWRASLRAAAERLGRLDVLVNSAGVREISSVLDLPLEEWNRVMGVNVTGTFLCSQAFARTVIAKGGKGAIVNLASTLGVVAASNRPPTRPPSMPSSGSPRRWRWSSASGASASMRWGPA